MEKPLQIRKCQSDTSVIDLILDNQLQVEALKINVFEREWSVERIQ